ncbi:hypothetical protein [Streptomyces sp. NBC_01190]|uniref:hypothetical protein n=1 Tax=Streptomyces sp. NBC_01190 TaxID=2903767 RepID=UPI00386869F0|nr:hypothetical protein OG519_33790 [Streptomyces sp. NBC_01190]
MLPVRGQQLRQRPLPRAARQHSQRGVVVPDDGLKRGQGSQMLVIGQLDVDC